MKKNGFTVVELIVSFSFVMAVSIFLFQIVVNLSELYQNNGVKTEILNKQSIISNLINESVTNNMLYSVNSCGENCYRFEYYNSDYKDLKIDYDNTTIQFGNYKTTLPKNTKIGDVSINVIKPAIFDKSKNDSILKVHIPLTNEKLENQNFDINFIYQYKSTDMYIDKNI